MENLKHLVRGLTGNYLQAAVSNYSFFVNDIAEDVSVDNNSEKIFSVINRLLAITARQLKNTCIRLTARKHGSYTILEIQESGAINSYALASDLQHVCLLANQLGGSLSISIPKSKITTVSFSFPNMAL
ncbi:MAG: hypothetical protein ACXWWC_07825 [Chitinophagaceae bacterium]